MSPALTTDPAVGALLSHLRDGIGGVLGVRMIGLYVIGSLVVGSFNARISDVDLVGVLDRDIDDDEFTALDATFAAIVARHPDWKDRIEVRLATLATLNDPASGGEIVSISPGEPLNRRRSDIRWQIDWYVLVTQGWTLAGPLPAELLAPISTDAFIRSIHANVASWSEWIDEMRTPRAQAYAVFALCRALYAEANRAQVSKIQAAAWARRTFPAWANPIGRALLVRAAGPDAPTEAPAEETAATARFVAFARSAILGPATDPG